jgi:hypothetical protein
MEQETKKYYSVDLDLRVEDSIEGDGDWKHLTANDVQISPEHFGSDEVIPYKSWGKYIILLRKGGTTPFILEANKNIPTYVAHFEELDGMEVKTLSVQEYFKMTRTPVGKPFDEEWRANSRRDLAKCFLIWEQKQKLATLRRFAKQLEESNPSLYAQMLEKNSVPATKQDLENEIASDIIQKEQLEASRKEYYDEVRKALNLSETDEIPRNWSEYFRWDSYDEDDEDDIKEIEKFVWIDDRELSQKLLDKQKRVRRMDDAYKEKYFSLENRSQSGEYREGFFYGEEKDAFVQVLNKEMERITSEVWDFVEGVETLKKGLAEQYKNTLPELTDKISKCYIRGHRSDFYAFEELETSFVATNSLGQKFLEFFSGKNSEEDRIALRYSEIFEQFDPEFCSYFQKLKARDRVSERYIHRAMNFYENFEETLRKVKIDIKKLRMFDPEKIGLKLKTNS